MSKEIDYQDFIRGIKNPKLAWVLKQLSPLGVPTRIHGTCISGPVLQIARGYSELAMSVIHQVIGEFSVGLPNRTITVGDLPDNHEFFTIGTAPLPLPPTSKYGAKEEDGITVSKNVHTPEKIDELWDDDDWGLETTPEILANTTLKWAQSLISVGANKQEIVKLYEVKSSHLSALGATAYPMGNNKIIYVGFKGGTTSYRYFPVTEKDWQRLIQAAIDSNESVKDAKDKKGSVGEVFWEVLRKPAESGTIKCQLFNNNERWVDVSPKKGG